MVRPFPFPLRLIALLSWFAVLPAGIGFALAEWQGALAGFVVADFLLILAAVRSEQGLERRLNATAEVPSGLGISFAMAYREAVQDSGFELSRPRIAVFRDPVPAVLVVRGLGSSGVILLSQGLLGILDEKELRAVLRIALHRNEEPEWIFNCLCAYLGSALLGITPRSWRRIFFQGEHGAEGGDVSVRATVALLILLPMIHFFARMIRHFPAGRDEVPPGGPLESALRKMKLSSSSGRLRGDPSLAGLILTAG